MPTIVMDEIGILNAGISPATALDEMPDHRVFSSAY